ncbi:rCG24368 [Rattus norvegicus]|uniref:RCG24368 n=1 Tax=Rattus norvegicus TaxID=10116 RepID=A6K580_RAT|nr:rCG24368 [Rattus norvegicus]
MALAPRAGPCPFAALRCVTGDRSRAAGICLLWGGGATSGWSGVLGTCEAPARPVARTSPI